MSGNIAIAEDNERKFKNEFELMYKNFKLSHLGKLSPVDFVCYKQPDQAIHSVIEFKQRNHVSDAYQTIWLNLRKVSAMKLLSAGFNCKAYFFVKWNDDVTKFLDIHFVSRYPLVEAGTFKRDWPTDRELVYNIPVQDMTDMVSNEPKERHLRVLA